MSSKADRHADVGSDGVAQTQAVCMLADERQLRHAACVGVRECAPLIFGEVAVQVLEVLHLSASRCTRNRFAEGCHDRIPLLLASPSTAAHMIADVAEVCNCQCLATQKMQNEVALCSAHLGMRWLALVLREQLLGCLQAKQHHLGSHGGSTTSAAMDLQMAAIFRPVVRKTGKPLSGDPLIEGKENNEWLAIWLPERINR